MNKELIERLRAAGESIIKLAEALETDEPEKPKKKTKKKEVAKTYTLEEARAILADKARKGFKAEVKAIITAEGVNALSDLKDDPEKLAWVVAKAEKLVGEDNG